MDTRNFPPPAPIFDPNTLDENFEIVLDYDEHGNLRRIRKVRREEGCFGYLLVFVTLVVVSAVLIFRQPLM